MGRYINTVLGPRWTDEPRPDEPTSPQYPSRTLQAFGRIEGKVTVLVEMGAAERPSSPAFTDSDIEEVGKLLVEGRVRLPTHASALTRTEDSQRRRTVRVCWNGSDCLASPLGST